MVAATRAGAAALIREAGTVDSFVQRVAAEFHGDEIVPAVLAVSGRTDAARAALAERAELDPAFARAERLARRRAAVVSRRRSSPRHDRPLWRAQ